MKLARAARRLCIVIFHTHALPSVNCPTWVATVSGSWIVCADLRSSIDHEISSDGNNYGEGGALAGARSTLAALAIEYDGNAAAGRDQAIPEPSDFAVAREHVDVLALHGEPAILGQEAAIMDRAP